MNKVHFSALLPDHTSTSFAMQKCFQWQSKNHKKLVYSKISEMEPFDYKNLHLHTH